ncbi:MAG: hypothetical protein U1E65_29860 [Myxococcota bacterium]
MNRLIYSLLLPIAVACGAETGNGLSTLKMEASSSKNALVPEGSFKGTDAQGSSVNVELARVNVRRIELDAPGGKRCSDDDYKNAGVEVHCDADKIRVETDVVFDLMTGIATPSVDKVQVPAGVYKRVSASLDAAKPKDGSLDPADPLLGHTLVASGTIDYHGALTGFDMKLAFTEQAYFDSAAGITVTSTGAQDVLMLLDVGVWFSQIPLTQCLDQQALDLVGGRIQIQDKTGGPCKDIEGALKAAIKDSGRLEKKSH